MGGQTKSLNTNKGDYRGKDYKKRGQKGNH